MGGGGALMESRNNMFSLVSVIVIVALGYALQYSISDPQHNMQSIQFLLVPGLFGFKSSSGSSFPGS